MALIDLTIPPDDSGIPHEVRRFLREADRRIDDFQIWSRVPAFVPSNYDAVYKALRSVAANPFLRGYRFCEWGSGFGVATCLAAMLDFDACGIEIEAELVDRARQLADDYSLSVEFVIGSFVPPGSESRIISAGDYAWLTTDGDYAYEELGLQIDDMDVIFAYPWPDEEGVTGDLFDRYAGEGAILVTFHGAEDFRIRRKTRNKTRRKR